MSRPLLRFDCPPDIFDTEGAYILRMKRIPVAVLDDFAALQTQNYSKDKTSLFYGHLAQMIPQWHGVLDVMTGEPLANPVDDPDVFRRLDALEQLGWLVEALRMHPKEGKPLQADPT